MLAPPTENHYLVRVPKKGKTGLSWRDVWTEPLPLQKGEIIVEPIDAIRLEKIKRRIPYRQGVWEVDYFDYPHLSDYSIVTECFFNYRPPPCLLAPSLSTGSKKY